MTFYENVEEIVANRVAAGIEVTSFYNGVKFTVYEQEDSVESRVFGVESNELKTHGREIKAIFPDDTMYHASPLSGGISDTVSIRTTDPDVKAGDQLRVTRTDGRVSRYTVEHRRTVGVTRVIYSELTCSGEGI